MAVRPDIGCLILGQTVRMNVLREKLAQRGVSTVHGLRGEDLLCAAQEGLYAARRPGGTCIAAEGELWAAALALSAQLSVDRVALIAPTDHLHNSTDEWQKQIERLKGFARRNLFFCVSDVLVLEGESDTRSSRRIDAVCRRMCNAQVYRLAIGDERWSNREHSPIDAAARFLWGGEFGFWLAK